MKYLKHLSIIPIVLATGCSQKETAPLVKREPIHYKQPIFQPTTPKKIESEKSLKNRADTNITHKGNKIENLEAFKKKTIYDFSKILIVHKVKT